MRLPQDTARPTAIRRAAASARLAPQHPQRWHVSLLTPLTGTAALSGDSFRNGVEMAVQEVNQAGGLSGRLVEISTFNTASSPQGARASLHRALEREPLALLGPVGAAETRAVAPLVAERRILQIAVADEEGVRPEPLLLLTDPGPTRRMAMLAAWLAGDAGIERLALLATVQDGALAAGLAAAWQARMAALVADLRLPPEPPPGTKRDEAAEIAALLARIAAARPQALFIGARGRLAVRLVLAARAALPGVALIGGSALLAPAVLAACGEAAIGLRGFYGFAPAAPVDALEDFRARFLARYHAEPDRLVMQGHIALSMLLGAIGLVAPAAPAAPALAAALRAAPLRAVEAPGILLDTRWDARGEPHRVGFVAEVLTGGALGWSVVPALPG